MEFSTLDKQLKNLQGYETYALRSAVNNVDELTQKVKDIRLKPVLKSISTEMENFLESLDFLISTELYPKSQKDQKTISQELDSMARDLFELKKNFFKFNTFSDRQDDISLDEYQELANSYYHFQDFYHEHLRDYVQTLESLDTPDLLQFGYEYNSMGKAKPLSPKDIESHYQDQLIDSLSRFFKIFREETQDQEHIVRIFDSVLNRLLRQKSRPDVKGSLRRDSDPFFFKKFANIVEHIPNKVVEDLRGALNFLSENPSKNPDDFYHLSLFLNQLSKLANLKQEQVLEHLQSLIKGDDTSYEAYLQLIDRCLMADFEKVRASELAQATLTVFKLYQASSQDWDTNLHVKALLLGEFDDHESSEAQAMMQIFYYVKDFGNSFRYNIYEPKIELSQKAFAWINSNELDEQFKEFIHKGTGNVDNFFDRYAHEFLLTNISKEEVQAAFSDIYKAKPSYFRLKDLQYKLYSKAFLRNRIDKEKVAKAIMLLSLVMEQKKNSLFFAMRSFKKNFQTYQFQFPYMQGRLLQKKSPFRTE